MHMRLVLWLYRCLLAFYPTAFRTEFEVEMKVVFIQALREPRASKAHLLWRELRDWPGLVWYAHHAKRREIMMPTSSPRVQPVPAHPLVPAGAWRDAGLAALAFLLYFWNAVSGAIFSALGEPFHLTYQEQGRLGGVISLAILIIDFIVVLLCWRRGWPRWGLPYLGIVLTFLVFFPLMIWGGGSILFFFTPLVALLIFLSVALSWWWRGLPSLYERLRSDWTLIGLAYFSCAPLVFLVLFNETPYEARANLIVSVILALGIVAYMRSASLWQRVVVLPVVFTIASLVAVYYLRSDYHGPQLDFSSRYYYEVVLWALTVLAPLLFVGILELWRYASHQRLQVA